MNKVILFSAFCALTALTACDHYSTRLAATDISNTSEISAISPAAGGMAEEMTFRQYLASEYYHMARYEHDQKYDFKAAKYYTEKAEKLSQGTMMGPAKVSDYKIPTEQKSDLKLERENLVTALKTYNIPENRYYLAIAQTRYDCWLEQQEDVLPEDEVQTCRNQFKHAMASLVPPNSHEVNLKVPFETGSMILSEEARISIGRALSFYKNNQERGYKIKLSPSSSVEREEADRQISMVRSILQFNGISPENISVDYIHGASILTKPFEILIYREDGDSEAPSGV